jgi:hypothetical protein
MGHPSPVHPSPVHPSPVHPSPVHPSPVHPSPVHPSPVHPSPVHPSPVHPSGSPLRFTPPVHPSGSPMAMSRADMAPHNTDVVQRRQFCLSVMVRRQLRRRPAHGHVPGRHGASQHRCGTAPTVLPVGDGPAAGPPPARRRSRRRATRRPHSRTRADRARFGLSLNHATLTLFDTWVYGPKWCTSSGLKAPPLPFLTTSSKVLPQH